MTAAFVPVDETEALLAAWIERNVGKVLRMDRQPRWRPAWAVDAERDGVLVPLYVKGTRDVHALVPVAREGRALGVLNRNGIPAPYQYGYCEEIKAIVMERLPGESRLETLSDIAERDSIVDQYVRAMVDFHSLDPRLFEAEGFQFPSDPTALRLAQFRSIETIYLAKKTKPEPANEFLRLWVTRNVPTAAFKPGFITGDAFQMIFHQGTLKGVMDLEMACIGDPLLDLACFRLRDLGEKTGVAARITHRYEEYSGRKIDYDALRFQLVSFAVASSLIISEVVTNPVPETDYLEYFIYYHGALRIGLEALAERIGVMLDPFREPETTMSRQAVHLRMLDSAVDRIPVTTEFERYQRGKAVAEIAYLQRADRHGREFDQAYLDDAAALLGRRPGDVEEADAALEEFVHTAGQESDAALVRLFHREALRRCYLADIPQNVRLHRYLREPIAPLL